MQWTWYFISPILGLPLSGKTLEQDIKVSLRNIPHKYHCHYQSHCCQTSEFTPSVLFQRHVIDFSVSRLSFTSHHITPLSPSVSQLSDTSSGKFLISFMLHLTWNMLRSPRRPSDTTSKLSSSSSFLSLPALSHHPPSSHQLLVLATGR